MRIQRSSGAFAGAAFGRLLVAGVLTASPAAAADVTLTDAGGRNVHDHRCLAHPGDRRRHHRDHLRAGSRCAPGRRRCDQPVSAHAPCKEKKNVGYMRALSTEGVISVGATLIIASERAGPPEVVKTLKTTSVALRRGARPVFAAGHRRQGAPGRARRRRRGRGREGGEPGGGRLQGAGGRHPAHQAAGQGHVRAGRAEWAGQRRRARARRHTPSWSWPGPRMSPMP